MVKCLMDTAFDQNGCNCDRIIKENEMSQVEKNSAVSQANLPTSSKAGSFFHKITADVIVKVVIFALGLAATQIHGCYKTSRSGAVPTQLNGAALCTTRAAGVCFDVDGLGGTLFVDEVAFNIVNVERLTLQEIRLHLSSVSNGASATARIQWSESSTYYMTVSFPDGRSETYVLHQAR